ncbi:P-loop NTPase family protein [Actinomadura harenae]|uniref:ATP-binding protein n=1 Tax=Actinomadura harenae TaxID=2483351 RepID=UPI0011C3A004|nr:ATP-binding protein [Actinomadura harenae]
MAEKCRPQELKGRQADLDQLHELVGSGSGYLSLVAPPGAGKTALLATFAADFALPNTDLVAYFVTQFRSDSARDFLATMCAELSKYVRKKPPAARDAAVALLELYKAAAAKSVDNHRNLLILIDGLDGDVGPSSDDVSIASLLPPRPYAGLVVLVSHRWHPPLPDDVLPDHPLRKAVPIAGFRPSLEAATLRAVARRDLTALLADGGSWKQEIVGFLAVANGALTKNDLVKLVRTGGHTEMTIPHDLDLLLHSVASRGLCPAELEPDAFVLAYRDLYRAALGALDEDTRSALLQRIHGWADGYREAGWPADSPGYLLHGYLDPLPWTGGGERRVAFALDHRRLLRLADRGRADLALASLDEVAQMVPTPVVLASAAASRSLLEARSRPVPRAVLRALCLVGDVERARSLALRTDDPASKAVRLAEVVRVLSSLGTEGEAKELAREAAVWAERAEREPGSTSGAAEWDTWAIVPRTAVVLAEVGLADDAIRLLSGVDLCRPENVEPAARAAGLLRGSDPAFAERVSRALFDEAERQEVDAPVFAVQIWASLTEHDPGRRDECLRRMKELSEGLVADSSGLVAVDCCAMTASALAKATGDDIQGSETWPQARELEKVARDGARQALGTARDDRLGDSLALLVQARLDLGLLRAETHDMLAGFPAEVTARAASLLDAEAEDVGEAEEASLLCEVQHSSSLGNGPQLRRRLDEHMKAVAEGEAQVAWLPFLAEALVRAGEDADARLASLTTGRTDPLLHVRVLGAATRAYAEGRRSGEAVRCAVEAVAVAERAGAARTPEMRALVAQAFAHGGEGERAAQWARPASGARPFGKAGIPYRRAALAVRAGLDPAGFVARVVADGLPGVGMTASGGELFEAFRCLAAGMRVEARVASLRTAAGARLATEPLLATGLALLQAARGEEKDARSLVDEVPDPAARGIAQATVAGYLSGVPAYLDVAAGEDGWTLSVLRVLAHHTRPGEATGTAHAAELIAGALGTGGWYWALPALARTDPDVVHAVAEVLDRHRRIGAPSLT